MRKEMYRSTDETCSCPVCTGPTSTGRCSGRGLMFDYNLEQERTTWLVNSPATPAETKTAPIQGKVQPWKRQSKWRKPWA